MTKTTLTLAALAAGFVFAAPAVASYDYPSRSVEVIHHYGPGGGTDRFVRAVA